MTMEPGESIYEDAHAGEEFGYVLKGKVQVTYGEKRATAKSGEWFYFASDRNHRVANPYKKRAKLLWVSTPAEFLISGDLNMARRFVSGGSEN